MKLVSARALLAPLFATLALGAAAAACSSSESSGEVAVIDEAVAAETWAKEFCDVLFSCGCTALRYPDKGACLIKESDHFEERRASMTDKGLVFDGQCLTHQIEALKEQGCSPANMPFDGCAPSSCFLFHGDKPFDEFCSLTTKDGFSDCVQGATCNQGEGGDSRCHALCQSPSSLPLVPDGAKCVNQGNGQSADCGRSSWCDFAGTGTCRPIPSVGERCMDVGRCQGDAFCSFKGFEGSEGAFCEARRPDGKPCDSGDQCEHWGCSNGKCGRGAPVICSSASSSAP